MNIKVTTTKKIRNVWQNKENIGDLSIEEVNDIETFRSLRETWNDLLRQCPDNNVFLTWEWLFPWWQHYGSDKKLRILLIKDLDIIIGIAPLMQTMYRIGFISVDMIENLCSTECDYSGIILTERRQESVLILLDCLEKITRDSHIIIRISHIPENSSFLAILREQHPAFSKSLYLVERIVSSCPYINLPATWEECYHTLTRSRRKKLQNAIQSLDNHLIEFKKYNGDDDLREQLQVLFELHQKRWHQKNIKSKFDETETREFYIDVSRVFYKKNWLDLSSLNIDGKPVSVRWGFNYNDIHYCMTATFDPDYSEHSVGNLHLMKLIEDSIQNKLRIFDFLKGIETHKMYWTSCITDNIQIIMTKRRFGDKYRAKYIQNILKVNNILRLGLRQYYHLRMEYRKQHREAWEVKTFTTKK